MFNIGELSRDNGHFFNFKCVYFSYIIKLNKDYVSPN